MAVKMAGYLQNESQDCACRKERGSSVFPFTETGTKPNSSLCYMSLSLRSQKWSWQQNYKQNSLLDTHLIAFTHQSMYTISVFDVLIWSCQFYPHGTPDEAWAINGGIVHRQDSGR